MINRDVDALNRVNDLVGKIALELALSKPDCDGGLLPVNCLLGQIEDERERLPSEILDALRIATASIENIFNTTTRLDQRTIDDLSRWANWMNMAVLDAMNDQPIERFGDDCQRASSEPAGTDQGFLLDVVNDRDLLAEFCHESYEHLQNIERGVLVLETDPNNTETLNTIFRAFHTFKGGAGLLNLVPIRDLSHELETVLDMARTGRLGVDTGIINLILEGGDTLKRFVDEISGQLRGVGAGREILVPMRAQLAQVHSIILGDKDAVAEVASGTPPGSTDGVFEASISDTNSCAAHQGAGVVKVDTAKLDSLVDLVGEMVVTQSQICQDKDVSRVQSERLTCNLAQLNRITKELQRTAMSLRMVPIRGTFQKMTRLVRDVSSKQGKQIDLVLEGEDTELDRSIVEELGDPLIHMIRNSVDHGIELPEDRVNSGKTPRGSVRLKAFHQGGNIVIQIADDGRGLKRDRILQKGIERGIISETDQLGDKDIFNLIFAPGFSTTDFVTDISGRGVGMDVVRRNIEKLRGKIDIESVEGEGSTFTIRLPLTLAIIDGLIVSIGDQQFILPSLCVRESLRPNREMITTIHGKGEMIDVRGRLSPLLRLYDFFDIKPETTDPTEALLVVVNNNGESRCLMFDRVIGKQEVVIKGIGGMFRNTPAIAGGAILGDGRVGLILDVNALVSLRNYDKSLAA